MELAEKKREVAAALKQSQLQIADQRAKEEKLRNQLDEIDPVGSSRAGNRAVVGKTAAAAFVVSASTLE